ncbi:unnamed protein product [Sphenostylis stenocarpa]|uniref:Uncharacterized protein n=1 Tax=Sphenostylis stenocarpa TaxID=92480 RepID=A0AA86SJF7_9FABA|nr:unnamed protein product [Sphenostylis stenocarpa]
MEDLESGSSGTPAIEFHDFVHGLFFGSVDLFHLQTPSWSFKASTAPMLDATTHPLVDALMLIDYLKPLTVSEMEEMRNRDKEKDKPAIRKLKVFSFS